MQEIDLLEIFLLFFVSLGSVNFSSFLGISGTLSSFFVSLGSVNFSSFLGISGKYFGFSVVSNFLVLSGL